MDMETMKSTWMALEQQLAKQNNLQIMQLREAKTSKARNSLRPLFWGQALQLVIGLVLIMISATFWAENIGKAHLMIYGISVHIYGICMAAFAGQQMYHIHKVDFSDSVVNIQKRIEQMRQWHHKSSFFCTISGCVIWIPLTLMLFYWVGADIWLHKPVVVYAFVVSGLMCLLIAGALFRLAQHPERSKLAAWLRDNAMPVSIRNAEKAIKEIEAFES